MESEQNFLFEEKARLETELTELEINPEFESRITEIAVAVRERLPVVTFEGMRDLSVDDFCQIFLPVWEKKLLAAGSNKRCRAGQLRISESMTILIYFHQSHYRNFKAYYTEHVCQQLKAEFPNRVSYERFVVLMPSVLGPLSAYLKSLYGNCSGISFVDSTALEACDPHRIHNPKVFEGVAQRGKGSMGWFLV